MSLEESLEERQDNEVAALKAIYGDAVTDVREQDVWKVYQKTGQLLLLCCSLGFVQHRVL